MEAILAVFMYACARFCHIIDARVALVRGC